MFLVLMVAGLAGLVMMALPAFARHGGGHMGAHAGHAHGMGIGRAAGRLAAPRHASPTANAAKDLALPPDVRPTSLLRFVPSPRAVCSVLALYGAFGNAIVHTWHTSLLVAGLGAVVPALLVEWALVRPVWNLVFRFEGRSTSPLEALVMNDATAVVPFRNGRGMVSTVRDGRTVQLVAELTQGDAAATVKVGDRLRIEDVDAPRERVTVSVVRD